MSRPILFISDLHISLEKKEITRRFVKFLTEQAQQAQALYILGDLFDSWIGDDDNTPPNNTIKQHLRQLTDSGVAVYLQVGNRDFLLGRKFAEQTGVQLLGDYQVIDLFGTQTLLTHGDLLCSDDVPYQEFRVKSRTQAWRQNVLSKPLWVRLLAARWYRLRSFWHKRKKSQDIMDVNQETVREVMNQFGCERLIHGHTHRPAEHDVDLQNGAGQRLVLADWTRQSGEYLCCSEAGHERVKLF